MKQQFLVSIFGRRHGPRGMMCGFAEQCAFRGCSPDVALGSGDKPNYLLVLYSNNYLLVLDFSGGRLSSATGMRS
jgi:hypothetical protein